METSEITFNRRALDSLSEKNIKNLRKVAEYIPTVPQKYFNMSYYRNNTDEVPDNRMSHNCNTVGCILGHSTILFPYDQIPKWFGKNIQFDKFSEKFFGIRIWKDEWLYLFGPEWSSSDNTPEGASRRILYFLKHGLPSNWFEQMVYEAPLSY